MSDANLFLFEPERQEEIKILKSASVGRADTNDIQIKDQSVSSKHARIVLKGNNVFLVDLNSFNSTYINSEELVPEKGYKVEAGDVLQFGDKVYYWCSYEPCQKYLDLPAITGSFKMHTESTGQAIVHNYEEPIIDMDAPPKKKNISLKALRHHKEDLERLNKELDNLRILISDKEKFKGKVKLKFKELEEFDSYLEVKNYKNTSEVVSIIKSVEEVNDRLEKDKGDLWEKISVLKNQIVELEEEVVNLDEEKEKNLAMISELEKDIEIIKGRENLDSEIQSMNRELENLESSDHQQRIDALIYEIQEKEQALKEAQESYAKTRFGKKGMFGNKAS